MAPNNLRPLSRAHLEAIGCVAVLWSSLEEIAEECLLYAADLDTGKAGHAITSQMGINQRLDALLVLVDIKMPGSPLGTELRKIDKTIRNGNPSIQTQRNGVVHGYWDRATRRSGAIYSKISAKGILKIEHTRKTAREIEAIANLIAQVLQTLESWQLRFLASLAETEDREADAK